MITLFHVLEKEVAWREANGQVGGFDTLESSKPTIAVGAEHPLEDEKLLLDYFRKTAVTLGEAG